MDETITQEVNDVDTKTNKSIAEILKDQTARLISLGMLSGLMAIAYGIPAWAENLIHTLLWIPSAIIIFFAVLIVGVAVFFNAKADDLLAKSDPEATRKMVQSIRTACKFSFSSFFAHATSIATIVLLYYVGYTVLGVLMLLSTIAIQVSLRGLRKSLDEAMMRKLARE